MKPDRSDRVKWMLSMARWFCARRVLGRAVPLLASVKLSYRCNLACQACPFHLRHSDDSPQLSWQQACDCLDTLARHGCRLVIFEGGEPLLWRDRSHSLHDLLRYARRRFVRVGITTNGTLPLDLPADVVWVSLDGDRATHNLLRSDSYDRVLANLQATTHPKVLLHCTVNNRNLQAVEPVARLARDLPTVRGMTLQLFYPYHQGEAALALSPAQRRQVLAQALQLKQQGLPILNSRSRLRAMIDNSWRCYDDILINVDPDGSVTSGCYVARRGTVRCESCGFAPVAEASGALQLRPGSIIAGWKIFLSS